MLMLGAVARVLVVGLLPLALVGCSHPADLNAPVSTALPSTISAPAASSREASPLPRPVSSAEQASAYVAVQGEVSAFLALWQKRGYAEASRMYLDPGQWLPSAEPAPTLVSARIVAFRPGGCASATACQVEVDLEMTFSGNAGAWGNGVNSRFVTATARAGTIPYVLAFATSQ